MNTTIVVVANGAHARFFTLEDAQDPVFESSPRLVEHASLINPLQETADKELWSDSKSGGNRSSGGGGVHGYDDHRSKHRVEYERRFVQQVEATTTQLARKHKVGRVVLAADNRVLGMMRDAMRGKNTFELSEVAKDYSKFSPQELHAKLASLNLVAPSRRPGS